MTLLYYFAPAKGPKQLDICAKFSSVQRRF